jgi:heat shock protein HslJ
MRFPFLRASAVLFGLALAGCATVNATSTTPPPLDGTQWVLAALPGRTLVGDPPATLRFEGGRAQGSDGCNRYGVGYSTDGAKFATTGPGMSTQMACAPEVMEQATAFMAALKAATSHRIAGAKLELLGKDGAVLAAFDAQSTSLAGTSWHATGINNGRQAVVSLVKDTAVTVEFGSDGRASGDAGCNRWTAGYEASSPQLKFTGAAATRRMCIGEGVMEQEAAFLKALETVASYELEGQRLTLRTADGAMAVTLARGPAK